MATKRLAPGVCPQGYTAVEATEIVGADRATDFWRWMDGQTQTMCTGHYWDDRDEVYRDTVCADNPHGGVTLKYDVQRFLAGLPVID